MEVPSKESRAASPSQALRDVKARLDRFMSHHDWEEAQARTPSRSRRNDTMAFSPNSEPAWQSRHGGSPVMSGGRGFGSTRPAELSESHSRGVSGAISEGQGGYGFDRYERELERRDIGRLGVSWGGRGVGRHGDDLSREGSLGKEILGGGSVANADIEDIDLRLQSLQEFLKAAKKGPGH
jgi:hypothetical protein